MAKWGQGDPRWLVTERSDGSNVNGWHWEEKNKVAWSKQRICELLAGLACEDLSPMQGQASITGLKDLTGEAYLTSRKGNRKFAVYDLTLRLSWGGRWHEDDKEVTGEIKVTEFASTSDPEEYEICVTAEGSGTAQDRLVAEVQKLQPRILERLEQYVLELNEL